MKLTDEKLLESILLTSKFSIIKEGGESMWYNLTDDEFEIYCESGCIYSLNIKNMDEEEKPLLPDRVDRILSEEFKKIQEKINEKRHN